MHKIDWGIHCLDMVQSRDFSETSEDSILDLIHNSRAFTSLRGVSLGCALIVFSGGFQSFSLARYSELGPARMMRKKKGGAPGEMVDVGKAIGEMDGAVLKQVRLLPRCLSLSLSLSLSRTLSLSLSFSLSLSRSLCVRMCRSAVSSPRRARRRARRRWATSSEWPLTRSPSLSLPASLAL